MNTNRKLSSVILIGIAGITLALPVAASALPSSGDAPRTTEVRTRDLDLTTVAGTTELAERIRRAARQVCQGDDASLATMMAERKCIAAATSNTGERIAALRAQQANRTSVAMVQPTSNYSQTDAK